MQVMLNGVGTELPETTTLEDAIRASGAVPQEVAAMVNGAIVLRDERPAHLLAEGDVVELVTYAGGGCG